MININEILKLFRFYDYVIEEYSYLNDYDKMLRSWLNNNNLNEEQAIRFMLIGFFFEYRSANHKGLSFNTIIKDNSKMETLMKKHPDFFKDKNVTPENNVFNNKKRLFNKYFGREIKDTEDYLSLLHITNFKSLTGQSLFDFVITGTPIG